MRGTGVHAIVDSGGGKQQEIKEIGERTWRGLRRIREIGDKESQADEAGKVTGLQGWENLDLTECHEAILGLSSGPTEEQGSRSRRADSEAIPPETAQEMNAEE